MAYIKRNPEKILLLSAVNNDNYIVPIWMI